MKIVLTGGLGHIGSGFLRQAPALLPGAHITIIDNLQTQRYCSLFNLPKNLSHEFIEADVRTVDLDLYLKDAAAVIHLGATTDAAGTAHDPNLIFKNNLPATERLAQSCIKNNVPLLFPSSTSVYGVQEGLVDEKCDNLQPQSPYAECKIQEENMIREFGQKGLKYCLARFGTIFGASPGMRFHTAVNKFCWQAAMNQPITVWSTAMDQKRPYLGLEDANRFIAFAIQKNLFRNELYNVVSANFTVRNVVDTIREFVPHLQVKLVDHAIMNQLSYEVSGAKLEALGYKAKDDLRAAVGETIGLLHSGTLQAQQQKRKHA
jgi:UDP-glucose 4-epimerase